MVTPLGATAEESAAAWLSGRSARHRPSPQLAGTPLDAAEVGELPQLEPAKRLGGRRMLKYMSEAALLGSLAAGEAAAEAGLSRRFPPERVGLFAATGLAAASVDDVLPMIQASIDEAGQFSPRLFGQYGLSATNPLLSFRILANTPPCLVSIIEAIKGPNYVFTPWEGQTAAALIEAARAVASGEAEAALAGAADSPAHPSTFVFLRQAGLISEGQRPASAAAYVLFERADSADRDGQRIYARVADMALQPSDGPVRDPLVPRLGRSFAAAPAILLALATHSAAQRADGRVEGAICGADRQEFRFALEAV